MGNIAYSIPIDWQKYLDACANGHTQFLNCREKADNKETSALKFYGANE